MASKDVQITVKVLDQASATLNKLASTAEGSIGRLQGLLAGAGMAAPLAYLTKVTYGWMAAVNDLEDATGMAGEEASKLLAIGSSVGLSAETMQTSFVKMAKSVSTAQDAMQQAAAAGKASDDIYSRFGITIQDTNGKLLPAEQILKNILEVHRALPNGIEKTNMEMEIFGKKGAVLNDFLNLSASEVDRLTKKFEKLGLIVGSESSQKWEDLRNKTRELELSFRGLTIQVGQHLLPALQKKVDWLNESVEAYGKLDEAQQTAIGSMVEVSAKAGILYATVGRFIPLWGQVAGAIWLAVDALTEWENKMGGGKAASNRNLISLAAGGVWNDETDKVFREDPMTMGNHDKPRASSEELSRLRRNGMERGGDDRRASAGGGGSSIQSMQERLANIIDDFNAKIMQETGTVFEGNAARLSAEISKIGRDLDEMATKGLDVGAARDVLAKYSGTMTDKYTKEQARALAELKAETAMINADITGDYVKAAEARYQAEIIKIKDVAEARRKTAGDTTAVKDWEVKKTKEAEQAMLQTVIDGESKKHAMRLQMMDFQRQQGLVSAETYRTDYLAEVEAFIAANQRKLQSVQQFSDQWRNLTQATSEAIAQKHRLLGQNINTAWQEAMYRMDQNSYDYADRIKSTFDEMGSSISNALYETISGTGDGLKNVFGNICNSILKMWADMIVQMYIMAPMKNMFSSMLGGMFGGGGGAGAAAAGASKTYSFAPGWAEGGYQVGPGTGTSDSILSWLSNGEYVVKAAAVQKYGVGMFDALNQMRLPRFANGGSVSGGPGGNRAGGDVVVNVYNQTGNPVSARSESSFDGARTVVSLFLEGYERNISGIQKMLPMGAK